MICKTILNFCVVHISNDEKLGECLTHMQKKSHRNHIDPVDEVGRRHHHHIRSI